MLVKFLAGLLRRFTASRLSTKILLLFAFLTVIPFVVLAARLDHANSELLRQRLLLTLQGQARSQASEIDSQLEQWRHLADFAAATPALSAYLSGPTDPATAAAARAALQRAQASDPSFSGALLTDRGGAVTLASDPALAADVAPRGGYLQAALGGHTTVSEIAVGQRLPAPVLYVGAPVPGPGGVAGALVLRVDPARILAFLLPTRLRDNSFAMLVDPHGVILGYSGPSPEQVLYHTLGAASPAAIQGLRQGGGYGTESIAPLGMQDLAQTMARGASGSGRVLFPVTNRAVETGFSRLATKGWTVAVMQDELEFLTPLHSSTFNTAAVFVAAAAIVGLLCFLTVRVLERTEIESLHDDLTGLPNRRYFNDILARELSRAERNHRPLSVINLDLDHFKRINDSLGHQRGDEVLQRFAGVLADQVRGIDLSARYGGEEFVVLLPDTDKEGALLVAEKVRRAAAEVTIGGRGPERQQVAGRLTVSAGVASYPDDGEDRELLLRRADQAMYLAKSLGRNQVIGFGSAVPLTSFSTDPGRINLMVRNANRATVEALAAAIDARDSYTHGHSRRVADYAALIGRELDLRPKDLEVLTLGALLHDLGKIGVPDSLLRKPGRLTEAERREVQDHTVIGHQMVQGVEFLRTVAPIILHHHENVDGSGYPHGLAGEEIPLLARIVKVADAFDAMTSSRIYREAAGAEWALGELSRSAGRQFDPEVVAALAAAQAKRRLTGIIPVPAAAS
ncbi:MAG TPA: diguanylate cyclase [Candidatus Dormibacteraeota bacterium]|nr:diguanylate cyclase [Candidatus Dormibacteraeota bacterium]